MNAARDPSINARVVEEFHANAGKVSGPWEPAGDLLLLHTIGAGNPCLGDAVALTDLLGSVACFVPSHDVVDVLVAEKSFRAGWRAIVA